MNDITENLIDVLEELYAKDKQIQEVTDTLLGMRGPGSIFLNKSIADLEYILIKYLGGNRKNDRFFPELGSDNPFYKLADGKITREEFLKQVKKGIELDLTADDYIGGKCSAEDLLD